LSLLARRRTPTRTRSPSINGEHEPALNAARISIVERKEAKMARIWTGNIEEITKKNDNFRQVLWAGKHSELTLMSIEPGSEIGLEVHEHVDQFLRIEYGKARIEAGATKDDLNETHEVSEEWAFIVPAGTWHNVINTGSEPLRLYTVYSPANHEPGTVHRTKQEADAAETAGH
jgi:mannose-6-phosphate isomerase-like protein (cupin superfamily)